MTTIEINTSLFPVSTPAPTTVSWFWSTFFTSNQTSSTSFTSATGTPTSLTEKPHSTSGTGPQTGYTTPHTPHGQSTSPIGTTYFPRSSTPFGDTTPVYTSPEIRGTTFGTPTPTGSGPGIGAIVGGIVGGIAFVLLAIGLAIVFYRFYKRRPFPRRVLIAPLGIQTQNGLSRPIDLQKYNEVLPALIKNSAFPLLEEFSTLCSQSPTIKNQRQVTGLKEENLLKNRYADILPFDGTRVTLEGNRYINASFIRGFKGSKEYIATQGPLGEEDRRTRGKYSTMDDFFEMVWQQNVRCIVMLTQVIEAGRPKCAQYWPSEVGKAVQYGIFTVFLLKQDEFGNFWTRQLGIRRSGESRIIFQYHYKQWPDMTAIDERDLLAFIRIVRAHISDSCPKSPTLVHCSAGVGRTGVFITLDILLQQIRQRSFIDIAACVFSLRQQRIRMVQTEEQYVMLYKTMAIAIQELQSRQSRQLENGDMCV